jgi:hypothetical protein
VLFLSTLVKGLGVNARIPNTIDAIIHTDVKAFISIVGSLDIFQR